MSIYEIVMLVCFGLSWPISIAKSIRTKNVAGKSPLFMGVVLVGYAAGIIHKMLYSRDAVIWLYAINMVLIVVDLSVYYYYSKAASADRA